MGWLIANGFLLLVVLIAAGYAWLVFFLLKLAGLHQFGLVVIMGFTAALVATYYTTRAIHAALAKYV